MKSVNLHKFTAPVRKGKATRKQAIAIRNELIKVQLSGANCQGYLQQVAHYLRALDEMAKELKGVKSVPSEILAQLK